MTKAMLKSVDYIRNNQSDILAIMAKRWGIEEPVFAKAFIEIS
jgi:hypothetical protein